MPPRKRLQGPSRLRRAAPALALVRARRGGRGDAARGEREPARRGLGRRGRGVGCGGAEVLERLLQVEDQRLARRGLRVVPSQRPAHRLRLGRGLCRARFGRRDARARLGKCPAGLGEGGVARGARVCEARGLRLRLRERGAQRLDLRRAEALLRRLSLARRHRLLVQAVHQRKVEERERARVRRGGQGVALERERRERGQRRERREVGHRPQLVVLQPQRVQCAAAQQLRAARACHQVAGQVCER